MTADSVYNNLESIFLGIGAALALVGVLRIYKKWIDDGAINIDSEIIRWIGGVMLCLMASFLASSIYG